MTPRTKAKPEVKTGDFFEAAILRHKKVPFLRMDGICFVFCDEDGNAAKVLDSHRKMTLQTNTGELSDALLWVNQQVMKEPSNLTGKAKK